MKEQASIGGYIYPLPYTISKNILNIYFTKMFQVKNIVINLHDKVTFRMVVNGFIKNIFTLQENQIENYINKVSEKGGTIFGDKIQELEIYTDGILREDILQIKNNEEVG